MKKAEKIKWNPIIARLADAAVKQNSSESIYSENCNDDSSRIKANWVYAAKRRSPDEFKEYIHELFDADAPKVKYHNPDVWNVYPKKKPEDSVAS